MLNAACRIVEFANRLVVALSFENRGKNSARNDALTVRDVDDEIP